MEETQSQSRTKEIRRQIQQLIFEKKAISVKIKSLRMEYNNRTRRIDKLHEELNIETNKNG